MSTLLIYMPALNEEQTIGKVIKSIPKKIKGFSSIEVLVINDGSTDNTEYEALNADATVVSHKYNKGVGSAFQTAVEYALKSKADVLASIDADGQFDVNQIEEMTAPIVWNNADFCIGNRFDNGKPDNMPPIKFWGNKQVNRIVGFVGKTKIHDASCGFRAYSREALLKLNLQGNFTYTHETILDLLDKGLRVKQVPVKVTYFEERVSRVANNLSSYAFNTLKIIIRCLKDYTPFSFFLYIALSILFIASLMGGFVLNHWISAGTITPYKSVGIFALSLCGMSLMVFTLALIADMIGRTRNNQEKILYLLKKSAYDTKEDFEQKEHPVVQ